MNDQEIELVRRAIEAMGVKPVATLLGIRPESLCGVAFGSSMPRTVRRVRARMPALQRAVELESRCYLPELQA